MQEVTCWEGYGKKLSLYASDLTWSKASDGQGFFLVASVTRLLTLVCRHLSNS